MSASRPSHPLLIRLAFVAIRAASLLVPRRDRDAWRREWTSEILHGRNDHLVRGSRDDWSTNMSLFRRSLGSLQDAAWLRRQFTRDNDLVHDVRHGLRVLRRQPGYSLLAGAVLALGIGSTTAAFSVADAVLLQSLPYPDEHELVAIWQNDTTLPTVTRGEVAPGNFYAWRERSGSLSGVAAVEPYSVDYTGGDRPEVLFASVATEGFFDILRVRPLHGRLFRPEDHVAGAAAVAVLEFELWRDRFAADPAIVGTAVPLDGQPVTIVGVLPADFELRLLSAPGHRALWLPKALQEWETTRFGNGWWAVIARLKPGVALEEAQADISRISRDLGTEYPRTNAQTVGAVEPLGEHLVGDARPALALLLGAVAAVLLIACANVANMTLVSMAGRERELAMRGALGAGRGRLVRQLLTETGLVALVGAAAGLVVAVWVLEVVVALAPTNLPMLSTLSLDWRLAPAVVGISVMAALAAGLLPALQHSRPRRPETLSTGRGNGSTRTSRRLGDGLAIVEIALAVTLVITAGLLLRSFSRLMAVDPGFRAQQVAALQVFAWDRQDTPEKQAQFFRDTIADLEALPSVVDAGAVSAMPFIGANIDVQTAMTIEGRPPLPEGEQDLVSLTVATPGYFRAMQIAPESGRLLADTDIAGTEPVAVISRALADRLWPGEDPLGSFVQVQFLGQPRRAQIVGVVGGVRHDGLDQPDRAEIFVPHAQAPFGSMTYVVRSAGNPSQVIRSSQEAVWRHDPLMTFYDVQTVPQLVASSMAPRRFSLGLIGFFAACALVLAAVGIYGVLSFVTQLRMAEFGTRMALGATRHDIGRIVIGRGFRLGSMGLILGLALALGAGRWLQAALFEISAVDMPTIAAVSAGVLLLAIGACYVPARRAMRANPIDALR